LASALIPATTSAQTQFEGKVVTTVSAAGLDVEMVQHMKGSMMRLDLSVPDGGSMSQIIDVESGESLMVVHEQKMWMDMAMMGSFMPGSSPEAASTEVVLPDFRRTERVETIAGRECRHSLLILEGGGEEVDVCATSGLGCFIPGAPAGLERGGSEGIPALPQSAELWLAEFPDGFFILSLTTEGASMVVSEVEPGSLPDEMFAPPADYTEMKVPIL
jgi:hypothetical protein